jgi:hypothetical protein
MPSGFFLKEKPPRTLFARARLLWFRSSLTRRTLLASNQTADCPRYTIISCSLKTNATAWTWCLSPRATRSPDCGIPTVSKK